jgi:hypothetical protein
MTIYYKVVENKNDVLCSSWVGVHDPSLTVRYEVGEWAHGAIKGSALFVFKTYSDATDYLELNNGCFGKRMEIYTCKIRGKRKVIPFFRNTALRDKLNRYSRLYKAKKSFGVLPRRWLQSPPDGTIAASSVKLIAKQV